MENTEIRLTYGTFSKRKPNAFTIRMRVNERGTTVWQVGENVCGDASYYLGTCAKRWFDKFVKRGLKPVFIDNASEPIAD